jgi:RES domain-containing protein
MIYASETYMGALLEKLAHANIGVVPKHQAWIRIDFPEGLRIAFVADEDVPGWEDDIAVSRGYGDRWISGGESVALVVPGIVARPHQRNVLFTPSLADFGRLRATEPAAVRWDERLFE